MAKGVSVTLYDAAGSPVASETDIAVLWFDSDLPPDLDDIVGRSAIATTTSGGVLSLDLDGVTGLAVGDWGFLVCYKLDGSDHEDSPVFTSRMQVASMTGTTPLRPMTDWVRNPDWPAQVPPTAGVQEITGLVAVFDHSANYLAFNVAGAYTIDWGDGGGTENVATGVTAEHNYTYSSVPGTIVGASKAVAVTFTDSGDTVDRTAHEYLNGQPLVFASVVTTTGVSANTTYYVVNRAANTFQVAATIGGSALALTTDGSGTVFVPEYKVAAVTITPQAANNITSFDINRKHSATGLQSYLNPWLSLSVNSASLTTMKIGLETVTVKARNVLEEFYLGENVITDFTGMFTSCTALASVPLMTTGSGTTFTSMFTGCSALQAIPYMDTSSGTAFDTMFFTCRKLRAVPLLDTAGGTTFSGMFSSCHTLRSVPPLDTSSGTTFNSMFATCYALREVPPLDTADGTTFQGMFQSCASLRSIPHLDTSSGTVFSSMFNGCAALRTIPPMNTAGATTFSQTFNGCTALVSIPALSTGSATTLANMFASCSSLQSVPPLSAASATNFSLMFSGCGSLASARLDSAAESVSVANCKLSAAALNDIFTGLATVTAKVITITGNYGAATCTTSIATSKGWTVTS